MRQQFHRPANALVAGVIGRPAVRLRWLAAGVAGLMAVLLIGTPASAHGQDAPIATDVRIVVTSVEPAGSGIEVRAVEAGARLELANHSARTVEILGPHGEPLLRVGPDGVEENGNPHADHTLEGAASDSRADWHRTSGRPVVRWHEERARDARPGEADSAGGNPSLPALLATWTVPLLLDGATPGAIRGYVTTERAPATALWWLGTLLLAGIAVLTGSRARTIPALLCGVTAIMLTVAFAAAATTPGSAGDFAVQLVARMWSLLAAVAVLVAGLAGWRRRADFALAATGACVTVAAGLAHTTVFGHAVLAGPAWVRPAVAVVIALGVGVTVTAARRWYASRPTTPTSPGTEVATTTGPS